MLQAKLKQVEEALEEINEGVYATLTKGLLDIENETQHDFEKAGKVTAITAKLLCHRHPHHGVYAARQRDARVRLGCPTQLSAANSAGGPACH